MIHTIAAALVTSRLDYANSVLYGIPSKYISRLQRIQNAPAIWNSLPSNVRSCETLTTFRRHLKSHLFHSAFATA